MAFIASVDKPCSFCSVAIPKGTSTGFTWDRTRGGVIHLDCMRTRKAQGVPVPVPATVATTATVDPGEDPENPNAIDVDIRNGKPWPKNGDHSELTNGDTQRVLAALQALVSGPRNTGLSEKEIRRIAADEANKVTNNRAIEIKVGEMPATKFDTAHKDLPGLLRLVTGRGINGHRMNVYMHGPAGSGKSTAARQASEAMKLKYGYMPLNPQTSDSRLLGYMHAGGEYVPSEFFKRYTEGGIFCLDEIDNASASLVTTLNSLLENGHGAFPHGVFPRHEDFVCVCTANTVGRGGDVQYPERRALDGAFLERFIFLFWDYDRALTEAIVTSVLGPDAPEMLRWVDEEARDLQARFPTLIVSPRAYIQSATLEKLKISRSQIRAMAIARGLK